MENERKSGSYGVGSPEEPALNIRLPSAILTVLTFAMWEPSFAAEPFTITSSPAFRESLLHPFLIKRFGLPSSQAQLITLPLPSFTSM
ncbi:MAG TPA: hypothetical protein VE422_29595 [Terriglobia bacterium]|nr:hypothetical protein [Terriglobia bacterium]